MVHTLAVSTFVPYHAISFYWDEAIPYPQPKICDPSDDDHVSPYTFPNSSPTILSPSDKSIWFSQ